MPCSLAGSMPFHHHPPCSPLLDISSAQDATSSRNPPLTTPTQRYVFLSLPPSPYSPCTKPSYALGWSFFYRHTGQLSLSIYCEPALEGQDNLRIRSTDSVWSQVDQVGIPALVSYKLCEPGHRTQPLCASGRENGDKNIVYLTERL